MFHNVSRILSAASLVICMTSSSQWLVGQEVINLWPEKAPEETKEVGPERVLPDQPGRKVVQRITDVSVPQITLFLAKEPAPTKPAVIVAPGGGYNILAYDLEGTEICEWLNSIGVSAVLLKYRVPRRDPERPHAVPLADAQRAVRLVRSNAQKWGIDADRIGMLGFSAGGHLTVMTGTHFADKAYDPIDAVDQLSARPDFLVPIYPAYLVDRKDDTKLDSSVAITKQTPPTLVAITYDDADRAIGAALLLAELKRNEVPGELHVYLKGGHGYGLRPSENPISGWPQHVEDWMRVIGMLPESKQ